MHIVGVGLSPLPEQFLPVIDSVRQSVSAELSETIGNTECFGIYWRDASGVCPEYECILRERCSEVYEQVEAQEIKEFVPVRRTLSERPVEPPKAETAAKHERHGYSYQGRPVDEMVKTLVESLGSPPTLPKNWSPRHFQSKYKELGRLLVAQTASYHVFLIDGKIVCRFWTNAANYALVDLSSLLVSFAQQAGFETMDITEKSRMKLSPCIGRMYCEDPTIAYALAKWIRDAYLLKHDNT